jgi:uncharacterized membrane protein HdeD (DUF308 family)
MAYPEEETGGAPRLALVDLDTVRPNRDWFIGLGVAFMVLGVLAIFLPLVATLVTTLVIGWLMVIGGVLECVHAVQNRRWAGWGWEMVAAVVHVVAGLLVVAFPVVGKLTLTLILAVYFVVEGILHIIRAIQHRTMRAWGWFLFDGVLSLCLGLLILLGWPSTAVWALGLLVGIELLVGGSTMALIGLGTRARAPARV